MKFSIIIPVYNVAPYLRACLDSLLAQTEKDWECICVDDGSMDGSGTILDGYAKSDARIRVVHKENGGVSAARNAALKLIRGDTICFVDADDAVAPDWLKTGGEWISKTGADIVRIGYKSFTKDVPSAPADCGVMTHEIQGAQEILRWGVGKLLKNGHLWRGFYRRHVVDGLTFPIGVRMMEDCAFQMWMLVRAQHVVEVDYPGYFYRQREGSAVHSFVRDIVADKLLYFAELRRWFLANKGLFAKEGALDDVQRGLWSAVFSSTMDAIAQYRGMRGNFKAYDKLSCLLREMLDDGSFGHEGVPATWKTPMSLYVHCDMMFALFLRWKVSAGMSKLKGVLGVRG